MSNVRAAFELEIVSLDIDSIEPIKTISEADRRSETYRRIASSIAHVGLIEPLVVHPSGHGKYRLVDGHTRLDVLKASNCKAVECLLATDDESYTYNRKVNYLSPIAKHYMILRALSHVSEERIAAALNVKVGAIRERRDLLNGICGESVEILKEHRVSTAAFAVLRKMKPVRQIAVAQLMVTAHKFSGKFARALLDGTNPELLVNPPTQNTRTVSAEDQAMMERETDEMLKNIRDVEATYGNDVLALTTSCRYIEKLLTNSRIRRYLSKYHAEPLIALEQVIADTAADKLRRAPAKEPKRRQRAIAV